MAVAIGCISAPEAPGGPRSVVKLTERYEELTASVDETTARAIVDRRLPQYKVLQALGGLMFLRDVVEDATDPGSAASDLTIDVQGSLEVRAPCPGWDGRRSKDESESGFIELFIGVDASRVKRAFTGHAEDCKFIAHRGRSRKKVSATMDLELDLGHSLGLGEPVPPILVRASEISGDLSVDVGGLDLQEASDELSVRLGSDDELETLIELETLNLGQEGTFVLALRDDDQVGVRGRDAGWVCGRKRGDPCVQAD